MLKCIIIEEDPELQMCVILETIFATMAGYFGNQGGGGGRDQRVLPHLSAGTGFRK